MADGEGFEPSVPCGTHAFQACPIDRSGTHPKRAYEFGVDYRCLQPLCNVVKAAPPPITIHPFDALNACSGQASHASRLTSGESCCAIAFSSVSSSAWLSFNISSFN